MDHKDGFQYEYFSAVTQHKIEWLWYPYIPYGKLTILQGDPGEGKSTFILNIAALVTRGRPEFESRRESCISQRKITLLTR